ncbi:MAG TPA: hypothetical protein VJ385_11450 [Fibrobacteria bacterium]|nr:hypothetical protein [Fibrobacteria bacterium]
MVWVCIALSIPVLLLLLLQFLRFHFSIDVRTPASLEASLGLSFLWFRREFSVDAGRAFTPHPHDDEDRDEEGDRQSPAQAERSDAHTPAGDTPQGREAGEEDGGQRGGLRLPDSWLRHLSRRQARLRKSAIKWALDFGVWRILLRFSLKSGRRVLGLLHPALKFLHLGMEDVYDLGRIAAAWSVLRGTLPALDCPVEFGFNEKPFNLQARLAGGFTGLSALLFGFLTLFSFPWIPLGIRFLHCWRDPRLSRWQRRVLLP